MGQAIKMNGRPVFASPAGENCMQAHSRPVDLVHLAKQTGGDRSLEEEVLQLFLRQAAAISGQMQASNDREHIKQAAHNIKGAARAVGAFDVAACADAVEEKPSEQKSLKALIGEIGTTCDYIASLLR